MTVRHGGQLLGASCGLGAAILFGVTVPCVKLLLPRSTPVVVAGLLYLGAGLTLSAVIVLRRAVGSSALARETPLRWKDAPQLLAIIASGGIVGPLLMLFGLQRLSGVAAALLLNLEAPLTILLAVGVFAEHLGRRETIAVAAIIVAAASLAWDPLALRFDAIGVLALAAACASWALDNNLTQRLSLRDPVALVCFKAIGAATCTLGVAAGLGYAMPDAATTTAVAVLGGAGYGLSLVLDTYALRLLGSAREAAYFATAPFVGALASVPLLGERIGAFELAAGIVMAGGIVVLVRERHAHAHDHDALEHDHLHVHDDHHQHEHGEPFTEPHAHPHRHAPLRHDHPHVSDLHHRHPHR